jgi:hypothetical protein
MTVRYFLNPGLPVGAVFGFGVSTYGIVVNQADMVASGAAIMTLFLLAMLMESIYDLRQRVDRLAKQLPGSILGEPEADPDAEVNRLSHLYETADMNRRIVARALEKALDRRDGRTP